MLCPNLTLKGLFVSNIERFENIKQIVKSIEPEFNQLAKIHGAVNYQKEASFALQILAEKPYTAQIAIANPDSFKRAIINVAAIGLSLNPVLKEAYLVPRDGMICLDISYRGLRKSAEESGSIKWAQAEIVREKDTFKYLGMGKEPIHEFNPFAVDRGEIVGGYCLAKTHDGEFILSMMPADEILSIRDRSASYKSFEKDGKQTPWKTDVNEMIKKTLIKRGSKSWPTTNTKDDQRFAKAIDVSNAADPVNLDLPQIDHVESTENTKVFDSIRESLKYLDRTEEKYLEHLVRVNRREIKKLEDLTPIETTQAVTMLAQLVDAKKAKENKNEIAG